MIMFKLQQTLSEIEGAIDEVFPAAAAAAPYGDASF